MLLLIQNCTYNPFQNTPVNSPTTISGVLKFDDGREAKDILVWLEGFELSTSSDSSGNFQIPIPPPESQGYGSGFNGLYKVYFYHVNYKIDSSTLNFAKGNLANNQTDFGIDGKLKSPKILTKILDIETKISPIPNNEIYDGKELEDSLRVTVQLKTYDNIVKIRCRIWNKPFGMTTLLRRTGVFFIKTDSYSSDYYAYNNPDSFEYYYILDTNKIYTWDEYILEFNYDNFTTGEYEIIPFIFPVQDNIPQELIRHIGERSFSFNPEYLELPIHRNSCKIQFNTDSVLSR